MSALNSGTTPIGSAPESTPSRGKSVRRAMHRISTVRREQGVSLRSAARRMGKDVAQLKSQEEASSDMKLSELYDWQRALEVPIADLLVDPGDCLSRPIMDRARLVRLMKTAAALLEQTQSSAGRRMVQNLVEQLVEIMPELAQVTPWHSVGQRRSLEEYGRAFDRRIADDLFAPCHYD